MVPLDINVKQTEISIINLANKIKNGSIEYFGKADPRFFELCWSDLRLDHLIVRSNSKLDKKDNLNDRYFDQGWSVCRGHGLLKTLETYIVNDHIIDGFEMFTDYNGKRFSELPRHLQRRVVGTIITVYVDMSFDNTDNTTAVDLYCEVLNNLK